MEELLSRDIKSTSNRGRSHAEIAIDKQRIDLRAASATSLHRGLETLRQNAFRREFVKLQKEMRRFRGLYAANVTQELGDERGCWSSIIQGCPFRLE